MTGHRLKEVLDLLPGLPLYGDQGPRGARTLDTGVVTSRSADVDLIVNAYKDLAFTWRVVSTLVKENRPLPFGISLDKDEHLLRAYQWDCGMTDDPAVRFAVALAGKLSMRAERNIVNALLLCRDFDRKRAAQAVGLTEDCLLMYEQLFYNVVDRRNEAILLAAHVYENTRLDEMIDGYAKHENSAKILFRAGYNNGMDYVLRLAGTPEGRDSLQTMSLHETKDKLETAFMQNGLLMVSCGFINQRTNAVGIQRAQALLAAAKLGGSGADEPDGLFDTSMSQAVYQGLKRVKLVEASEAQRALIAGTVDLKK